MSMKEGSVFAIHLVYAKVAIKDGRHLSHGDYAAICIAISEHLLMGSCHCT
jgi:hypothetical protein